MPKFVRGPFRNVEEAKAELRDLMEKGYRDQDITIVTAKKEDARILDEETPMQVVDEDARDIASQEKRPFWQQITNAFTGYFFNYDYRENYEHPDEQETNEDDPQTLLAGYRENLENGELVIIVDDSILNKESRFNFDALEKEQAGTTDNQPREEKRNADPAEAMEETTPEQDSHPDIEDTEEVLEQETPYVPGDTPAGKSAADMRDDNQDTSQRQTYVPDETTSEKDWSEERSNTLNLDTEPVPTDDPSIHGDDLVDMPENNDAYSKPDDVPEDRSGLTDAEWEDDSDAEPGFYRENLAVQDDTDFPEVIDPDRDTLVTYDPDGDDEDPLRRK